MNKRWEEKNGFYMLFLQEYDVEEELAKVYKDDDGDWTIDSKLLDMKEEYFECGNISISEMKEMVEERIVEHYQDKINYYQYLLEQFKEDSE